jgi:hypothetical protein
LTSIARSEPSEPHLTDACGRRCFDLHLPDPLTHKAAAEVVIPPGRCVVLHAVAGHRWECDGVKQIALRVGGRVPCLLDDVLDEALARCLLSWLANTLDWVAGVRPLERAIERAA